MPDWSNDEELFALMRQELFSAVVGDVMDAVGLTHQFLPADIRPLKPEMIVIGRAMPVLEADCSGAQFAQRGEQQRFGLLFEALDDLKPNEVYLASGSSLSYALWGELMATRAQLLQAAGAVLNGYHRDTWGVLKLNFPTFSRGAYAQDQGSRGRVIDFRCGIEIGQVLVRPGDIVFGDVDGVVVVPRAHEEAVVSEALEKVRGENEVRKAIEGGMSTVEAFRTFNIM